MSKNPIEKIILEIVTKMAKDMRAENTAPMSEDEQFQYFAEQLKKVFDPRSMMDEQEAKAMLQRALAKKQP